MGPAPLLIWVQSPPFVEAGPFNYLEETWSGGVIYVILTELRAERKAMGWAEAWQRTNIRRRDGMELVKFVDSILVEFGDAVHLVAGMTGVTGKALSRIAKQTPPDRIAVFSERPGAYGPLHYRLVKRMLLPVKYKYLALKYRKKIGLLLPLGQAGRSAFRSYGWRLDSGASFMYCPVSPRSVVYEPSVDNDHVKFLYVGRLSRFAKGTDVLQRAVDRLHGGWSLTLVGGHGDLVDEVGAWAKSRAEIVFTGAAAPDEVKKLMLEHDVCVVPSRVDGWNVVVNESLVMGRGVIVTNNVGSNELVEYSGAGLVVRAGSERALAEAMQRVIEQPSLVHTWSKRAERYAPLISPDVVGEYLGDLLSRLSKEKNLNRGVSGSGVPPWLGHQAGSVRND